MAVRLRARVRLLVSALVVVAVVAVVGAAVGGASVPLISSSDEAPDANAAAPRTVQLREPADDARVEAVPTFSWRAARGAQEYEFQIAADPAFESIVNGRGRAGGSFKTRNTFATLIKTLPDGTYYWRVRGLDRRGNAGRWSRTRSLVKRWTTRANLLGPDADEPVVFPTRPLVLRWSRVHHAHRYLVTIATDPSLASPVTPRGEPVDTAANVLSLTYPLTPGRYYWAVTPVDVRGHSGTRSEVGEFTWTWPSTTTPRVADVNPDERVYEPEFSWDEVPGAVQYEVEVNHSQDFAVGSKVCCDRPTTATTHAPPKVFANNTYYWRVRALDADGNAGVWNRGPDFQKDFDPVSATNPTTIRNLRVRDNDSDPVDDVDSRTSPVDTHYPVVVWDPVPGAASYEVEVAPDSARVPQCDDGKNNDSPDDSAVDFPNDPQCTSAADTSERPEPSQCNDGLDNDGDGRVDVAADRDCLTAEDIDETSHCDWTAPGKFDVQTATTAWTPLSPTWNNVSPIGEAYNRGVSRDLDGLGDDVTYCVRVRARADRDSKNEEVLSDWTQLNGLSQPAFGYDDAKPGDPAEPQPSAMQASDYLTPQTGTTTPRMPFFTWNPVPYADSYYVVVAKDSAFTEIADMAITRIPAYAPRFRTDPWTYSDETTAYYWAVLPAQTDAGGGVNTQPQQNAPRTFFKQSVAPQLLGPSNDSSHAVQPTFRWTAGEGVREYRLQVAQDPTFGDPIEDIATNSTAYTSPVSYPADTLLYWRVRVNDERKVGLSWSATGTFRQRLPVPALDGSNPGGGETIPALAFSPVQGAMSYDVRVDQVDGTDQTFRLRSPVFTPSTWFGNGVWHFQVRANFKSDTSAARPGPWSESFAFARRLGTPAGTHAIRQRNRVLIEWEPVVGAKHYRVEIATSDSFNRIVESAQTDNTSFAPVMSRNEYRDGTPLHWRVTPVDEGNNQGGTASGELITGKRLRLRVRGRLRRNRTGTLTARVTDTRRRAVRGATVEARGVAGARPRRTSRRGTARLRLRPTRSGRITIRAVKRGYRPAEVVVRVR